MSFTWATSRAALCLERIIPADFFGTVVQCDGYQAYPSFAKRSEGRITLAACWAHARRKFHEALENAQQHTGWLLLQIQHLYRIEKQLRMSRAGPRQRQAIRAAESRMIVERIHRAHTRMKRSHRHLPKSAMGRAIDYALTHWTMLCVHLEEGRVEIGRVGNRRRDFRREKLLFSGGFHHNISAGASGSAMVPFPVPAPRTGRAAFPHPALIPDFPAFALSRSSRLSGSLTSPSVS